MIKAITLCSAFGAILGACVMSEQPSSLCSSSLDGSVRSEYYSEGFLVTDGVHESRYIESGCPSRKFVSFSDRLSASEREGLADYVAKNYPKGVLVRIPMSGTVIVDGLDDGGSVVIRFTKMNEPKF